MEVSLPGDGRPAFWIAVAAGSLALGSLIVWIADLATRPPCPANYVRLIDIERLTPIVSAAILVGCVFAAVLAHRGSRSHMVTVVSVVLAFSSLISVIFAIGAILSHRGPIDNGCWTF